MERAGRECVFIDTNILADALYGKYIPGKSDPFKSMVAQHFENLLLKVLESRGAKSICLSRFQLDVELIRAAINAVMRRAPSTHPEDLLILLRACETLREMFGELSMQSFAIIIDYGQPRVAELALHLYARCRNLGIIGPGRGGVGSSGLHTHRIDVLPPRVQNMLIARAMDSRPSSARTTPRNLETMQIPTRYT